MFGVKIENIWVATTKIISIYNWVYRECSEGMQFSIQLYMWGFFLKYYAGLLRGPPESLGYIKDELLPSLCAYNIL